MNQVSIIGRLGADVELRYTQSGKAVSRMSVAVNERYGDNERVYWFPVICWNGLAETVSNYLHKGSKTAIAGRLTTRSFENDDGNKTVTEIVAHSVDFLDPKPTNNKPKETSAVPEDDIPF